MLTQAQEAGVDAVRLGDGPPGIDGGAILKFGGGRLVDRHEERAEELVGERALGEVNRGHGGLGCVKRQCVLERRPGRSGASPAGLGLGELQRGRRSRDAALAGGRASRKGPPEPSGGLVPPPALDGTEAQARLEPATPDGAGHPRIEVGGEARGALERRLCPVDLVHPAAPARRHRGGSRGRPRGRVHRAGPPRRDRPPEGSAAGLRRRARAPRGRGPRARGTSCGGRSGRGGASSSTPRWRFRSGVLPRPRRPLPRDSARLDPGHAGARRRRNRPSPASVRPAETTGAQPRTPPVRPDSRP
jgi:hypothetical protein